MRKYRFGITYCLAALLFAFVAGCGLETVTVPSVLSAVPANGTTSVLVNSPIGATFSMAMNPASISAATFTVTGPAGPVAGSVSYSGVTATFAPVAVLAYSTVYTGTITTGATNLGGTPMTANYTWTFTTITPPPTVTATIPANGAANVPIAQALSATFSEAMNPASIGATTFLVTGPGGAPVAGTVTYSGTMATFAPSANLANGTLYTATITTGATDVAGTPLAANYVWTFTTITPPPVVIATVPVTAATGVPLNQLITATFNDAMTCSTLASPAATFTLAGPGAASVAGTVSCAGALATFTPGAQLAVNTLYTATIASGVKSLAGTTMANNYVWAFRTVPAATLPKVISTVPVNLALGVPVNQIVTATFSEAISPATINSSTFTLTGPGATAVSGAVSYAAAGSVATFAPAASLTASTVYTATITAGATDLDGAALAVNYVWTFTTAAVPLNVPPTVLSAIPANAASSVPLNQLVSATFSKAMNPATIDSNTFTLTAAGGANVAGLVAYAAIGNTLTFTPSANLTPNTLFTAAITTGAKDLAGIALATNYVWSFTTGATFATIAPELIATIPANSASDVPLNQAVSATFTEAMNPLTLTTATFQLTGPGGTAIAGTVNYDAINFIATFTPAAPLIGNSSYTATVTNGATDMTGIPLGNIGSPDPWTFMTGTIVVPPPVVLGPTVSLFGGLGGGAGMTNQGIYTVVNGSIATTGASSKITGFHDDTVMVAGIPQCVYTETTSDVGLVTGTIDTGTPPPTVGCPSEGTAVTMAIASQAALEAQNAYITLSTLPPGITLPTNELGNLTLPPGTYTSSSFYDITAGPLTLDAQGDPNAVWIFQIGSYLQVGTPTASESIVLIRGAQAKNVYWAVGGLPGAVINYGGGGTMVGTIVSQPGITISSPGVAAVTTINGRVLALNASVTMVNTVINLP